MLISTLSLLSGGTAHALPRRALRCGRLLARGLAHAIRVFCLCRAVRCAFGLAVCGAALALSACSKGGVGDGALTLYGNVDIRQIALAFEGSGRVLEMAVDEGARVQAGQTLAVLDTQTLALQAAQARAQIEAQRQSLRKLESGTRPQEVAQAQSRVAAARADAARARQDLARLRQLAGGGAASRQALEHAQTAAQVAEAKVRETQEALRLAQIGPREEDIATARAQLKAAEAALALLEHQIEQGALRAPVSAVVRACLLEPGDMASPQRPAYTLALTQPKWVRVYVAEPDLGRVAPGIPAAVTTASRISPCAARWATSPPWPNSRPGRCKRPSCAPASSMKCACRWMTRPTPCGWASPPPCGCKARLPPASLPVRPLAGSRERIHLRPPPCPPLASQSG